MPRCPSTNTAPSVAVLRSHTNVITAREQAPNGVLLCSSFHRQESLHDAVADMSSHSGRAANVTRSKQLVGLFVIGASVVISSLRPRESVIDH
jgi:transcription initiation factor TFIID subunit TAF12